MLVLFLDILYFLSDFAPGLKVAILTLQQKFVGFLVFTSSINSTLSLCSLYFANVVFNSFISDSVCYFLIFWSILHLVFSKRLSYCRLIINRCTWRRFYFTSRHILWWFNWSLLALKQLDLFLMLTLSYILFLII